MIKPRENAKGEEVIAEEVTGHHQLWTRIKALMTSLCFVSIMTLEWFPFEDCEFFIEET